MSNIETPTETPIQAYLEGQQLRYSATTLGITRTWLEHLARFLGNRDLLAAVPADLTEWHRELVWRPGPSGQNYSQNTVNLAVGSVRRFYRWAASRGLVPDDPTVQLKTRGVRRSRTLRPPSEARKLLDVTDETTPTGMRNRALLGLLLETLISRAACSRLDLAHLQTDTGALLVDGRNRQLHSLSEGLVQDLQGYLDFARPLLAETEEPALFVSRYGRRLTAPAIRQVIRHHARLAGVCPF